MRGLIGAGTNRINIYVRQATEGGRLDWSRAWKRKERGVAILPTIAVTSHLSLLLNLRQSSC